jgi:hypothetical protein
LFLLISLSSSCAKLLFVVLVVHIIDLLLYEACDLTLLYAFMCVHFYYKLRFSSSTKKYHSNSFFNKEYILIS